MPAPFAQSMIEQRSEVRLALVLLGIGFLLQIANPFFDLGSLTTGGQRIMGLVLVVVLLLGAWLLKLVFVPWDAANTRRAMP